MSNYPLVKVTWHDAQEGEEGWQDIEKCIETPMAICYSVGWLISRDEEKIVLMATAGKCQTEDKISSGGDCTAIPANWTTKIEYLVPKTELLVG